MKWLEKQAGSSVKRDNWPRGWKEAIKSEETSNEIFYATKISDKDLPNININSKSESKTCETEAVEKGSREEMVDKDNRNSNQDVKGKVHKVVSEKKVETKNERIEKDNQGKSERKVEMNEDIKDNRKETKKRVEAKKDSTDSSEKKTEIIGVRKEKENAEKNEKKVQMMNERKENGNKEKSERKDEMNDDRKENRKDSEKKVETKNVRKESNDLGEKEAEINGDRKEIEDRKKSKKNVATKSDIKEGSDSGKKKVEMNSDKEEEMKGVNESKRDENEAEYSKRNENRVELQCEREVKIKDGVNESTVGTKRDEKEKQNGKLGEMKVKEKGDTEENIEISRNETEKRGDGKVKESYKVNEKGDAMSIHAEQKDTLNQKGKTDDINIEVIITNKTEINKTSTPSTENRYKTLIQSFSEELKYDPEVKENDEAKVLQMNSGVETPLYDEVRDIEGELTMVSALLGNDRKRKRDEREVKNNERTIKIIKDRDGHARRIILKNMENTKKAQNVKDLNNNETKNNTERKYKERAEDLLITGVMPLCPPGRRDWDKSNEYNVMIKDFSFSWPPVNWREMTPNRRLLAWEFAAMSLEEKLESEISPAMSRGYLLDKYNFLALPGTSKHQKEAEETAGSRARFYAYQMLREIAEGKTPSKAEEIHIQCLEQNRNFSNDFILKIRSIQAPLRLNP